MQKKLERLDFIIRDAYADGNITHEIYIEATSCSAVTLHRHAKNLNPAILKHQLFNEIGTAGNSVFK